MLKGILDILWSAYVETWPTGSKHMSYSVAIMNKHQNVKQSCQILSTFMENNPLKDAAVYCRITCQKYEYYTEYFTHKVKYFFTYLNKFE